MTSMYVKYQEELEALEAENRKSWTSKDGARKTGKTHEANVQKSRGPKNGARKTRNTPDDLGMIATWSHEFGYVSIHDPTSEAGEWHDVAVKNAPAWALGEARKRKELYKAGDYRAYRLTSRQMEEIWQADQVTEEERIVEDHPIEEGDE